ncbi:DUF5986 family protein [Anaerovorax odorimutans]|uniref:DUF5986 family protein n=1 Tax=Anaerovorax odorimutans TaxID=109327 RepID=A0ABT1RTU2_9FIRM|nr:DUF5986 family protein [Anaerovorax odorimutans]MCQ4638566.1 DUF5986 family protein [Anaerovorax odorimutans]
MKNSNGIDVDAKVVKEIVGIVNDSIGDRIKEDVRKQRLRTQNSTPTRIWDLLNTSLCEHFESDDCMSYITKRGPWQMVMLFEKKSGFLFTFMREKRFAQLAQDSKRKNMHYLDMLTRHLNSDLQGSQNQMSLFEKRFNDQDQLQEAIDKLLKDLHKDDAIIQRHILVLFESSHYVLNSVRAVMIDSNLDIVAEVDWSEHIVAEESTIVGYTSGTSVMDSPTRGLKLTKKAAERKRTNPLKESKEGVKAK